jgi:hypothetical protein
MGRADYITTFTCRFSGNSVRLIFLETLGPVQACIGIALSFYHLTYSVRPSDYTLSIDQELADGLWLCGTDRDSYFKALC